jgi:hypothetical protein
MLVKYMSINHEILLLELEINEMKEQQSIAILKSVTPMILAPIHEQQSTDTNGTVTIAAK